MLEAPQLLNFSNKDIISFVIEQDNQKYLLNVTIEQDTMTFNISEQDKLGGLSYTTNISFEEIKKKEPKQIFSVLNSCQEFIDYLKALSELKKIFIIKKENKISIKFDAEYLLKKYNIEIDFLPDKVNSEKLVIDLCKEIKNLKNELEEIKNKMKNLEEKNNKEIEELKNEIKELKKIIEPINEKYKNSNFIYNSTILKENEFDIIKSAIKSRMNKDVKNLKKLYQATVDGESSATFHSKCDGIPNTITFIKSAGKRRFGGFNSQCWDCSSQYKDDINCFLFSLDKQKIYPIKNDKKAICCNSNYGPVFGLPNDIQIGNNPISEKNLHTRESKSDCSFNYYGDNNALSEDGKAQFIYALEYEVFQVIF